MAEPIYLDHAATTPVRPEVMDAMRPYFETQWGNPSSVHRWGREARAALDEARERVAHCLGAAPDEICFTSGGTEADNLAVIGAWRAMRDGGRDAVVTTPIEHKAILGAVHQIAREGGEERFLTVSATGLVEEESVRAHVDERVAVTSVMWVNNEIGTIQPIAGIAALAKAQGSIFHTDAVQAFGKVPVDVRQLPVDLLSTSGHKLGAPKGVGAMFVRRGVKVQPLFHGGTQDRGRRPGTENVAFCVGFARAAELAVAEREAEWARLEALRDALERAILARVPDAVVHGRGAPRAPHILNLSVPGTDSEALLMALDLRGIGCSAGSACQSGSIEPSHVLSAIGVSSELAGAAVRMSLGKLSTPEGIARVAELFPSLVERARATVTSSW
ncbi:MAG TPA: cysteine desulfurase family protein [Gemmatimonadaceae bacterium]